MSGTNPQARRRRCRRIVIGRDGDRTTGELYAAPTELGWFWGVDATYISLLTELKRHGRVMMRRHGYITAWSFMPLGRFWHDATNVSLLYEVEAPEARHVRSTSDQLCHQLR